MANNPLRVPRAVVTSGGNPIGFADRLLRILVHDEAGFSNDRIEFELDDREPQLPAPSDGQQFSLSLGFDDGDMYDKGTYVFDEYSRSTPPDVMTVICHAFDTGGTFKTARQQSYHGKSIGDIVGILAGRNGFSPVVDGSLASIQIPHRDQTNQSDMAFVKQLAVDNNATAKVTNGQLVFAPRGQTKSASGQDVTQVTIRKVDVITANYRRQSRGKFGKASVPFRNEDTGIEKRVIAPSGGNAGGGIGSDTSASEHATGSLEPTKEEAERKAQSNIAQSTRNVDTFNFTIAGIPELGAETIVNIEGFASDLPTSWIVSKCDHTYDARSGFITHCECEQPGQDGGSTSETTPSVDPSSNDANANDNLGDQLTTGGTGDQD